MVRKILILVIPSGDWLIVGTYLVLHFSDGILGPPVHSAGESEEFRCHVLASVLGGDNGSVGRLVARV